MHELLRYKIRFTESQKAPSNQAPGLLLTKLKIDSTFEELLDRSAKQDRCREEGGLTRFT